MSQFVGYGVQLELKDGKVLEGKITKATSKGLILSDVKFEDGGTSQLFKIRASRLKDLKVTTVRQKNNRGANNNNNNNNYNINTNNGSSNNNNNNNVNSNSNNVSNANSVRHDNGTDWAHDDVSKIKLQDDFDFQSNLDMFNKKDVFAKLKQQDDIDPKLRLVAHNKKDSSRGNKPRNYEIDEMVIPNAKDDSWHKIGAENSGHIKNNDGYHDFESGTEEEEEDDEEDEEEQGVQNKSRADDDDDEQFYDADDIPITKAVNITHLLHKAAKSSGNKNKNGDNNQGQDQMLAKLEQMIIQQSKAGSVSSNNTGSVSMKPNLLKIKDSSRQVATATPVQLLEIERLAQDSFGITAPILLENFAINLANFLKQKLGGKARLRLENSNAEPLVVILTSDSVRSGARALALGRQLCRTGHIRVITMFTTPVSELQDKFVKEQLDMFKKCGGKVVNSVSSLESAVDNLNSPVEIVVDAMQGFDYNISDIFENIAEEELLEDDNNDRRSNSRNSISKSTAIEQRIIGIMNWCNKQRGSTKVWSLNVPTGFDSGSGVQNFAVAVQATGVICTGWPISALSHIKQNLERVEDAVAIDMGIPRGVYSLQNSLRKFLSFDMFPTEGSVSLEFQ
ncbi:Enhancer of mRNA-decapping protein 3 [Nakaseomyces bracarensis]|uniref:Enhancer of mRNA-decapping protein 3 n=1 Tax=Nakaseomyces bracarensis TaxID=273131 RepID=A0ABR4NWP4_9SACH